MEVSALRCPVQLPVDLGGVAVNLSVVAWSARKVVNLDVDSGCLLASIDELLH